MTVEKEHMGWFAELKPGDEMAVRLTGHPYSSSWRREVVTRRTATTVWWGEWREWLSATPRTRAYNLRPVTDEDREQWRAEKEEQRVWRWINGLPRKLPPPVRAALLRVIEEVSGE